MTRHRLWSVLVLVLAASGETSSALAQEPSPVPADFYPMSPCRAVDTRESEGGGPLLPGVARWFTLDGCGVPLTAYAAALNVTVVDAVGTVEITAFPGDLNPGTSTIVAAGPWSPNRAALAVLRLATDGTGTLGFLGLFSSSSGQAHLILDVTGYFDIEDPGSTEDPGGDDSQSTLGQPDLPYTGDPTLLDDPALYPPHALAATAPPHCKPYTGNSVTPIGVRANSPRYLAHGGQIKLLVGASADAACHFVPTPGNKMMVDKCHINNYTQVLTDLKNAGFNKTRLWVALGKETDVENLPFLWDEQGGYWRLDQKNQAYFDRLRAVVIKAQELDMYVEVTFFAPGQGPKNGFGKSPWSWNGNLARALDPGQTGPPTRAGFMSPYYAVIFDTSTGGNAARNERMRQYQRKVIEWTIEELWCYDRVIWEIANEPEDPFLLPLKVADWQRSMIAAVRQEDCAESAQATECTQKPEVLARRNFLTRRHLIAVQPFTRLGGDAFIGDARVAILSGHYTQVLTDPVPSFPNPNLKTQINLGAIDLVQRYANQSKVLGFNEGKITPLGGPGGTRRHVNGVVSAGPEGARAEAWEFLLNRGSALDHWGYLSKDGVSSPTVTAIRQQLIALKTFMLGLPLERLKSSVKPDLDPEDLDPIFWIINGTLNKYPVETEGWDPDRSSQRYWAAVQTDETAVTDRLFLLYLHNSTRRCINERNFTAAGCPGTPPPGAYLAFGGYDARVWTTPQAKRHPANFDVDLGPNPGTFDVFWINPADLQTVKQQAIAWKRTSCSLPGCIICSNPSPSNPCSIGLSSSERYGFDILLKIVQRP